MPVAWRVFVGRSERRERQRGPMIWVDFVVSHLVARHITLDVVLLGPFRQLIIFLMVLQSATVHIVLAQASHLSDCHRRVLIVLYPFRFL